MKRLLLLRHGKSDWAGGALNGGLDDVDRPLAPRGIKAAPVMGQYLRARKLIPDLVLCSAARRTRQTWDLVAAELGTAPEVRFLKSLYLAPPSRLLGAVRKAPAAAKTLLLIGHNPGLAGLALRLAGGGRRKDLAALADKFPTCALAVIDLDISGWPEVGDGGGRLTAFVRPRDLTKDLA